MMTITKMMITRTPMMVPISPLLMPSSSLAPDPDLHARIRLSLSDIPEFTM